MEENKKPTDGKNQTELKALATEISKELRNLSNQAMIVPVGQKDLILSVLILEVEKLTETGLEFINLWLENKEYIKQVQQTKN